MALIADFVTRNPQVRFARRAVPVPPDMRALWRVASVVLILRVAGRGQNGRCSLRRLHALAWACRSPDTSAALREQLESEILRTGFFISVDPAVNLAIDLALAEDLVVRLSNARLELTSLGKGVADDVLSAGLLEFEVATARALAKTATEGRLDELMRKAGQS